MYWAPNLTEADFRHCTWCAWRQWEQLLNVDIGSCLGWVYFTEQYIVCVTSCTEFAAVKSTQLESSVYRIKLASSGKKIVWIAQCHKPLWSCCLWTLYSPVTPYLMHFSVSFSVECNFLIFIPLRKGWFNASKVKYQRGGSQEKVELSQTPPHLTRDRVFSAFCVNVTIFFAFAHQKDF